MMNGQAAPYGTMCNKGHRLVWYWLCSYFLLECPSGCYVSSHPYDEAGEVYEKEASQAQTQASHPW
jgi:hypothetical protein